MQKYDVALYRRGKGYVLHRVIGVEKDHYLIRGDNTYAIEKVPDKDVIGVLTSFKRKGKEISTDNRLYRFYVRFWNVIYPIRALYAYLRLAAIRAARRAGLVPLIKKVLGRE